MTDRIRDLCSRYAGQVERRLSSSGLSANAGVLPSSRGRALSGYAARFNSLSEDLGGFTEVIRPGAFARSLKSGKDIKCLLGHDAVRIVASQRGRTLDIWEDSKGLAVGIDPVNTSDGKNLLELVRTGHLYQMSFGFLVRDDHWFQQGDEVFRELRDVDLHEISAVAWPAYSETSLGASGGRSRFPGRQEYAGRLRYLKTLLTAEDWYPLRTRYTRRMRQLKEMVLS